MVILAGQIAGKNNRFALFTHKLIRTENRPQGEYVIEQMIVDKTISIGGYLEDSNHGLEVLQRSLETFIRDNYSDPNLEPIYGACFGIASPVKPGGNRFSPKTAIFDRPELKATFTERDFAEKLPCKALPVGFLNDMEAIGYGMFLGDGETRLQNICHNECEVSPSDRRALMLVSDGLGEALWYWEGDERRGKLIPIPSEGGHADFADPTPDKELSKYLESIKLNEDDDSPISYEYVLSTSGLLRIYLFLKKKNTERYLGESTDSRLTESIIEEAIQPNPIASCQDALELSKIIIEKAIQPNSIPSCQDALKLFIKIWGAEAGNLALRYTATGGVYIVTTLPIPIENLQEETFEKAFITKESRNKPFREYNSKIPVKLLQDPDIFLWGAARYAINNGFISRGKSAIDREGYTL
jgi:glucokinase